MIAYKGFTKDITATLGKGVYQFELGKTVVTEKSKTANTGFHCCENPFECLCYYPLNGANRFFQVEAGGSIDEDEYERIACTELTLLKELTRKEFAGYGMVYMIQHPMRSGWKQHRQNLIVTDENTESHSSGEIVIVRNEKPMVKGVAGSIVGLIVESSHGTIESAGLYVVGEEMKEHTWYTLDVSNRTIREV